ncbi:MAG TPA: cytochrome b/b6 domain-containing protein [Pyrinomonadaceae bacterium]|nr:cytochrome b/b6 domain-containing protein [Pyrinomonadaceae bacterium]
MESCLHSQTLLCWEMYGQPLTPVVVITGILLFQQAQFAWQVKLLGGFGMIRLYHFAAMIGFLSFVPGHLLMVALHGWSNFYSMLTGWNVILIIWRKTEL